MTCPRLGEDVRSDFGLANLPSAPDIKAATGPKTMRTVRVQPLSGVRQIVDETPGSRLTSFEIISL